MVRRCLITAVAMLAVPALAQNWVQVGRDQEVVHYVDSASLVRDGDVVRVTKRAVYNDPQRIGDTPGLATIAELVGVVEDDCKLGQHRVISIRLQSEDGTVIWSSGDMRRIWESIEPDSPGMATLAFACSRTASRQQ